MVDPGSLVAAASALINARGDGAVRTVAAAVLTSDGRVSTGLNLYHFTGGPCAELTALANAAAASSAPVVLIVAVGDAGRGVIPPCGRCRQVLLDLHPDSRVLLSGQDHGGTAIADLLPASYVWQDQARPDE